MKKKLSKIRIFKSAKTETGRDRLQTPPVLVLAEFKFLILLIKKGMCLACLGDCTMRSPSELQLLQHGGGHWLPRCCHQLGASWPIIENVAWSTYEIAARSMVMKTIRSFKMFSTGLTHGADGKFRKLLPNKMQVKHQAKQMKPWYILITK